MSVQDLEDMDYTIVRRIAIALGVSSVGKAALLKNRIKRKLEALGTSTLPTPAEPATKKPTKSTKKRTPAPEATSAVEDESEFKGDDSRPKRTTVVAKRKAPKERLAPVKKAKPSSEEDAKDEAEIDAKDEAEIDAKQKSAPEPALTTSRRRAAPKNAAARGGRKAAKAKGDEDNTQAPVTAAAIEPESAAPASKRAKPTVTISAVSQLCKPGQVMAFGMGGDGQLGRFDADGEASFQKPLPGPVTEIENAVFIASGALHNAVLCANGDVYTWGCNDEFALGRYGQRGKGEERAKIVPSLSNQGIVQLALGASHSLARSADGKCYAWGSYRDARGLMGCLGKEVSEEDRSWRVPEVVSALAQYKIVDIAAGAHFSLALTDDGTVFEWGDLFGNERSSEIALVPTPILFPIDIKIARVFAHSNNTACVDTTGTLWVKGPNNWGQCGFDIENKEYRLQIGNDRDEPAVVQPKPHGVQLRNVTVFASGEHHTLVLRQDGTVLGFGRIQDGRLGCGTELGPDNKELSFRWQPREVVALCPGGQPGSVLKAGDRVVSLACGEAHSFAVTEKGYLFAWGSNVCQCLGHHDKPEEVKVPRLVEGGPKRGLELKYTVSAAAAGAQHSIILASLGRDE